LHSLSQPVIGLPLGSWTVQLKQWQRRSLEAVYPLIWLDAIHYKIREDGRYQSKTVYTVLALNLEGKKGILGL